MVYVIAEPCIGTKDTACVDVCPVDCIHPKKDEANFETVRAVVHRTGRMHRLRRLRACVPSFGYFCTRRSAREMVAIYRGQRGLVQDQQIATPPSPRHSYDHPRWAAARERVVAQRYVPLAESR